MIFTYVSSNDGKLVNTTDLAVRAIEDIRGAICYDVVARMLGEDGNTYVRSLGSICENDIYRAYKACFEPKMFKVEPNGRLVWTNAMFLRQATLTKYDYCYEGTAGVQAIVVLAGKNHHIELNREKLRDGEGGIGGFCILRLMAGDAAYIDGTWLYYDSGLHVAKVLHPDGKMVDYTSQFNASTFISTTVTLF